MRFTTSIAFIASIAFAHCCAGFNDSIAIPALKHIFSGTIDLGKPLSPKPIPIPGGVQIIEPIVGGTLSGPAINASVAGGLAYPQLIENRTVQVPFIILYGKTEDGVPYLVQEAGIGVPKKQYTRIQISIGGKYKALADSYTIASVSPSADGKTVAVEGFQVML